MPKRKITTNCVSERSQSRKESAQFAQSVPKTPSPNAFLGASSRVGIKFVESVCIIRLRMQSTKQEVIFIALPAAKDTMDDAVKGFECR